MQTIAYAFAIISGVALFSIMTYLVLETAKRIEKFYKAIEKWNEPCR